MALSWDGADSDQISDKFIHHQGGQGLEQVAQGGDGVTIPGSVQEAFGSGAG